MVNLLDIKMDKNENSQVETNINYIKVKVWLE